MLRNMSLVVTGVGIAILVFGLVGRERVSAQEASPTPAATSDLGLVIDSVIGKIGDNPTITWQGVDDVDHFELTGTLTTLTINLADPFCTQPSQPETRTITLNETLGDTATSFTVPFPQSPPGDGWFVSLAEIRLRAVGTDGEELGSQGGTSTAEAICSRPIATMTPPPTTQLPSTGHGSQARSSQWGLGLLISAIALTVLGTGVFGILRR